LRYFFALVGAFLFTIVDLGFLGIFALLLITFNGFLAAILVRVAFYLVWHVLYVH
jgi:hypothetical protein